MQVVQASGAGHELTSAVADPVIVAEYGWPQFNDDLLAQLTPIQEAELGAQFDELAQIAAAQPDNRVAISGLKQLIMQVHEQGYIGMAQQMAMTVGAMACNHVHMESLAKEAEGLFGKKQTASHELIVTDHDKKEHDEKECADCTAGRDCQKRHVH